MFLTVCLFGWLFLVFLRCRVFDSEKASSGKQQMFAEKQAAFRKLSGLQVKVTHWSGQCNDVFSLQLARL